MSSWSRQRKFTYGAIVIVALVVLIALPAWKIFYTAPTCFDGLKNGDELGVDCSGSCTKLCASAFIPPIVGWTRFDRIAPNTYNVAAYIINQNIDGEAKGVPYHMQIYDNRGILITEYDGKVTIPPHRNALAYEGTVNVGERIPAKALFEFDGIPDWNKNKDGLSAISVIDKKYTEDSTGSSLLVSLKNTSVNPIGKISLFVVLYDGSGNATSFSKTIIDSIGAGETVEAPFTWPARNNIPVSIEVLPVAE